MCLRVPSALTRLVDWRMHAARDHLVTAVFPELRERDHVQVALIPSDDAESPAFATGTAVFDTSTNVLTGTITAEDCNASATGLISMTRY
jgi:hypothetical protein